MLFFDSTKDKLNNQIIENLDKLYKMQNLYSKKLELYKDCFDRMNPVLDENKDELQDMAKQCLNFLQEQIDKINNAQDLLKEVQVENDKVDNNDKFFIKKESLIAYSGELYQKGSNNINIVYGYGDNWEYTTTQSMDKTAYGFITSIQLKDYDKFNFCFSNENNVWDNNNGSNYIYKISNGKLEYEENSSIFVNNKETIEENKNAFSKILNLISKYNDEYNKIEKEYFNYSVYEDKSVIEEINKAVEEKNNVNEIKTEDLLEKVPDIISENVPDKEKEETQKIEDNLEKKLEEELANLKDNGVLLISEVQGKVILPYTVEEVLDILEENNSYRSPQEVIDDVFTKPFDYYRNQVTSRFKESVELITKREGMSILDGINLGSELFKKRYLHPAIISACKNLDELNVYLDCLDKNELDDFKIFEIKYELNPMLINESANIFKKISNMLGSKFSKEQ